MERPEMAACAIPGVMASRHSVTLPISWYPNAIYLALSFFPPLFEILTYKIRYKNVINNIETLKQGSSLDIKVTCTHLYEKIAHLCKIKDTIYILIFKNIYTERTIS